MLLHMGFFLSQNINDIMVLPFVVSFLNDNWLEARYIINGSKVVTSKESLGKFYEQYNDFISCKRNLCLDEHGYVVLQFLN